MAAAPFNMAHATPVPKISSDISPPPLVEDPERFYRSAENKRAHPYKSKIAAVSTNAEMEMRIVSSGIFASRYTPNGVAKRDPANSQRKECQSISLQTCGTNFRLARTSRIRTSGTTWTGGSTSDMLVTATIANPKPLYPLMMPATKYAIFGMLRKYAHTGGFSKV
jgi:hypothetical protein